MSVKKSSKSSSASKTKSGSARKSESGKKKAAASKPAKSEKKGPGKKERIEILKKFTKQVLEKHGPLIRSIVLFGSTARGESREESDIDVFVIVDDTKQKITPSMKAKLEEDLEGIAKKLSKHMSVQQPYLLTEFWSMVRDGHPIVFNFIREGVPVYDKDVFLPIKRLLQMGEIKPSKEAVEKFLERAPKRIRRVENAMIYMVVEDLYYAMLESAQAVLMFLGKTPPRPPDAADAVRKYLVSTEFLEESYAKDLEDIIRLRKEVEHKRVKSISGKEIDEWLRKAKRFVKTMQKLIVRIEILKREGIIEKSHLIMRETALTLLKAMKKPSRGDVMQAFEEHLVKPGIVDGRYLEVMKELERMKELVKKGKVMELPKQHILMQREYVRKFIHDAGKVMRKNIRKENDAEKEDI